jgi:starvation-inducible DNA-binding protein
MKNYIGIDNNKAQGLVENLNLLLANYQMFYQNLRGLHWNIQGKKFFELHVKFEEYYDDAIIKVDEIAERILTLGGMPLHTFNDYMEKAVIKEAKNITDGDEGVKIVLENLQHLLEIEREILPLADDANDEGTLTLLTDYITQQEKTAWMLNAYLS